MIRQESTYNKETGEIIEFKEYCNNTIINHHINEKNYTSIKLYNEGKLYREEIRERKNQRKIIRVFNSKGEIIEHNERDLNGNLRLQLFQGNFFLNNRNAIRIFKFDNKTLSEKYDDYSYKLNNRFLIKDYYIQLETREILNDYTYIRYGKKYPVTQEQCTQMCTWNKDTLSSIFKINQKQLDYINDIILDKKKPYEQSKSYHK